MSDDQLQSFMEDVEANEEEFADLVALEAEIAYQAHEQLDDNVQSAVSVSDLLPKVDDALGRFKDWWDERREHSQRSNFE